MAQYLGTLRETHDDRLQSEDGNFCVEHGGQRDFGQSFHQKDAGLYIELLVVSNTLEELEVEDVKARRVVLRYLHLFQQRLAENSHWDSVQLLEQEDEVVHHHVPHLNLPVELDQDEGQCLVDDWRDWVAYRRELLQQSEHQLYSDYAESLLHIAGTSLENVQDGRTSAFHILVDELRSVEPDLCQEE